MNEEKIKSFEEQTLSEIPHIEIAIASLLMMYGFMSSPFSKGINKVGFKKAIDFQYTLYQSFCDIAKIPKKSMEQILEETKDSRETKLDSNVFSTHIEP